jgi:hypothetical protein
MKEYVMEDSEFLSGYSILFLISIAIRFVLFICVTRLTPKEILSLPTRIITLRVIILIIYIN